jgi:aspartate kinase
MTKIKIGGVMRSTGLAKMEVKSTTNRPGIAGEIMKALGEKNINAQLIVQCIDSQGNESVIYCIAQDQVESVRDTLEGIRRETGIERIAQRPNVAIVSVFGPDFRNRPGIAGTMFSALNKRGIDILVISTSISTLSCVIDADHLDDAVATLEEAFELP